MLEISFRATFIFNTHVYMSDILHKISFEISLNNTIIEPVFRFFPSYIVKIDKSKISSNFNGQT